MSTFTPPADIAQITLAKSSDVNAIKAATGIAFALLPSETKLQRGTVNFAVDTGTANTYVAALDASITTYTDGLQVVFRPLASNTSTSTINLNGLGAKSIVLTNSDPIQAGDISAGAIIDVRYSTATGFFHLTPNSAIYAHDAGVSATAAAASASTASTQATNAASSASSASTSASAASTSASNASASASTASTQATNAASSASSASGSASTATTQASNASTSASAASTSATNASTQATNAANSASTASTQATNAATSATAAAASYDSFDDRYLGAKASDPTLDNDGNALLTGALYWNSTSNEMRVYSGSAWITSYLPASGYLALSGGTMTGAITFAAGQTFAGTATTATNVAGGSNGTIPYQSASGTTQMLAAGTATYVLTSNGSAAPTWAAPAGGGGITLGTPVATTSGTSIDFTGIPAGTKQIVITFNGVSTDGTSAKLIQIGDSGGIETTGYSSCGYILTTTVAAGFASAGYAIYSESASHALRGSVILTLESSSTNTWCAQGVLSGNTASNFLISGDKSLSATCDRVRITTELGTQNFDAGSINIAYI